MTTPLLMIEAFVSVVLWASFGVQMWEVLTDIELGPGLGRVERELDGEVYDILKLTMAELDDQGVVPGSLLYLAGNFATLIESGEIEGELRSNLRLVELSEKAQLDDFLNDEAGNIVFAEPQLGDFPIVDIDNDPPTILLPSRFDYIGKTKAGINVRIVGEIGEMDPKKTRVFMRIGWNGVRQQDTEAILNKVAKQLSKK